MPATARRPISKRWRTRSIDGYVATGRARDAVAGAVEGEAAPLPATPSPAEPASAPTRVEAMRAKIKAGGHDSPYRLRKQLPEPVFGQIKQARGFRQFLLRGFEKVRAEWAIVCTAHNLLKLALRSWPRGGVCPPRCRRPLQHPNGRAKGVTKPSHAPPTSSSPAHHDNLDRLLVFPIGVPVSMTRHPQPRSE